MRLWLIGNGLAVNTYKIEAHYDNCQNSNGVKYIHSQPISAAPNGTRPLPLPFGMACLEGTFVWVLH